MDTSRSCVAYRPPAQSALPMQRPQPSYHPHATAWDGRTVFLDGLHAQCNEASIRGVFEVSREASHSSLAALQRIHMALTCAMRAALLLAVRSRGCGSFPKQARLCHPLVRARSGMSHCSAACVVCTVVSEALHSFSSSAPCAGGDAACRAMNHLLRRHVPALTEHALQIRQVRETHLLASALRSLR